MEKLSIITVCYDAAEHIETALSSVQEQLYPNIEHVVIDGGSTDGTLKLLEHHRGELAHLVSEPDKGLYDAMNKGIEAATGGVLFFLNADDRFVDPQVVSDMMSALEGSPDIAMVYGDILQDRPEGMRDWQQLSEFTPRSLARRTISHQSLFARRAVFEEIGGFSLDFRIVSDFHWLMRLVHSKLRTLHVDRDVCIIGVQGLSNTTDWEPERLSAMREFYTPGEIFRWRTLPRLTDRLPRSLRTRPRPMRSLRRTWLVRSLRSWLASKLGSTPRAERPRAERGGKDP